MTSPLEKKEAERKAAHETKPAAKAKAASAHDTGACKACGSNSVTTTDKSVKCNHCGVETLRA